MAKIMVIQHVPHEPLGTIDARIKRKKHRIRYVNFSRHPDIEPTLDDYQALIILGGSMNVTDNLPFIKTEMELIEKGLKKGIPILGICLGCQLIAATLGAPIYPAEEKELGWKALELTDSGKTDPVLGHLQNKEQIFQWHGHTYENPTSSVHLARTAACPQQAFRYGENVYGFQFHLEITVELIERWLQMQIYLNELPESALGETIEAIQADTQKNIQRSLHLSEQVFDSFLSMIKPVAIHTLLKSR